MGDQPGFVHSRRSAERRSPAGSFVCRSASDSLAAASILLRVVIDAPRNLEIGRSWDGGEDSDLAFTLAEAMLQHGIPEYIRSDNGPEFIAKKLRKWLSEVGAKTLYIEPGSPWENGYCESFNGKLKDECLNGEIFYSLKEARVVIEKWRVAYNTVRPHSSLGYRPPAPLTILTETTTGCGDVENTNRFPHLHTPGGDAGQPKNNALH